MGNRACVVFADAKFSKLSPAVYLHWNGGAESVYAFLQALDTREVRADQDYECARFIGVVHEFFSPEQLSLGVTNGPRGMSKAELAGFVAEDNGLYVVCRETGKFAVRRFVNSYDKTEHAIQELSPARVDGERQAALAHTYNASPDGDTIGARLARSLAAITEANKKEHS